MRTTIKALCISGLAVFVLTACGGNSEDKGVIEQLGETAEKMSDAADEMDKLAKEFEEMDKMEPVPPVHFNNLIKYLPMDAFGLTRSDPEGETAQLGEWQYSRATVDFTGSNGESVNVEIFDYAHIGALYAPYRIMLAMKYNRESTEGYERSTEFMGFPGYEKWEIASKRSEVTVLVNKRFIVSISTHLLPEGQARSLIEVMDLLKLAGERGVAS